MLSWVEHWIFLFLHEQDPFSWWWSMGKPFMFEFLLHLFWDSDLRRRLHWKTFSMALRYTLHLQCSCRYALCAALYAALWLLYFQAAAVQFPLSISAISRGVGLVTGGFVHPDQSCPLRPPPPPTHTHYTHKWNDESLIELSATWKISHPNTELWYYDF